MPPPLAPPPQVDIVVPVFNALSYTRRCLESVCQRTNDTHFRLIIVNDGSNQETSSFLQDFCKDKFNCELLEHKENLGYTLSVNTGMKFSRAPFIVLLNSDTEVSDGWLPGLLDCFASDDEIGIAGPLSNAASWQSVPVLLDHNKQFCINELPTGVSVQKMAAIIRSASLCHYPKVPFVNGFCFMVSRSVIDKIGFMDDKAFPKGYGEENDYCLRAAAAGFKLAIADNAYVHHSKSKSFGHEARQALSKSGSETLRKRYGHAHFTKQADKMRNILPLNALRQQLTTKLEEMQLKELPEYKQIKVLFVLPKPGIGGGSHSVVQETQAMRKLGVDAGIAVEQRHLNMLHKRYHEIEGVGKLFVGYTQDNFLDIAGDYDIVVATIFHSTNLVKYVADTFPHILPAYYIQDYEPLFYKPTEAHYHDAINSYTRLPNALLFAKTFWIMRQVEAHHGVAVSKVSPSIDHAVYYPPGQTELSAQNNQEEIIHIAAMIRPRTPRRGAVRTMQLLANLKKRFGSQIHIHLFGCTAEELQSSDFNTQFEFSHYGVLQRTEVADLLRQSDIFIDLSDYQAFGRTALEAMACGATAMVPVFGGTDEYAVDGVNALVVNTFDLAACEKRLAEVIRAPQQLEYLKQEALACAQKFSPEKAAISELSVMQAALALHRRHFPAPGQRPKLYILHDNKTKEPHRLYNDRTAHKLWQIQSVQNLPEATSPKAGAFLTHGEMPLLNDRENFERWHAAWQKSGGIWVHELTHIKLLKKPAVQWTIKKATMIVLLPDEAQANLKDFKQKLLVSPSNAEYLLELRSALHTARVKTSNHKEAKTNDKQPVPYEKKLAFASHLKRDRRQRLWRKFKSNPKQYFADSKVPGLKHLKYLFPN